MNSPLVSICCITYNHVNFIEETLKGFLIQKTSFKYEIIINDDASNDGTTEILKKYKNQHDSKINLIIQKKNQYSQGVRGIAAKLTFPHARGKYIALCEGDDYWTDPLKLQKQVDFLEGNPEYNICWTKYKILNQTKNNNNSFLSRPEWIDSIPPDRNFVIDLNNVFTPYCTYTLTCMFRKKALDSDLFTKMQYAKDNTLYILCLLNGKGILLDFFGAVYRLHNGGVYSNASIFNQKYFSYLNIKEIVTIPECNNKNIRTVYNYLLLDSLIYLSRKNIFKYIRLFWDSFLCFGLKKTIIIFLIKIKGETLTRKSIG